jgi:wyosine [tRNA(Phe)-imidazoG37] synthetase (radical SAM superfamily)
LAHPARRPIIDTVLISGNGEPTLHPQFLELVKSIFQKISELSTDITGSFNTTASKTPRTRVVCLTNGDRLDQRDVVEALNLLDEAIVKLDVGTEVYFKEINRPLSRASVAKLMNGSRRLTNLSIQTAILPGKQGLAQSHLLDDWIESIAILRPQTVYIHPVQGASEDDAYRVCHFLKKHLEKRADNGTKIKALVESDFAA